MVAFWKTMCACNSVDLNRSGMRVGQENMMNLCTVREIWELNSPSCANPMPNTFAPLKPLFCLPLPKQLPVKRRWQA